MSGRLLETLGRKLIKGWKSSFRQPAPFTSASQWEWGLLDSWDGCEWRAEGRNFPGDKAEAAHRGLGGGEDETDKKCLQKERAKRKGNIYGMPRVYFLFLLLFYFSYKYLSYKEAFSIPTLEGFL